MREQHVCVHACVHVCVCAGRTPTKQSLKGDKDNVSEKSELTLHTAVGAECFWKMTTSETSVFSILRSLFNFAFSVWTLLELEVAQEITRLPNTMMHVFRKDGEMLIVRYLGRKYLSQDYGLCRTRGQFRFVLRVFRKDLMKLGNIFLSPISRR